MLFRSIQGARQYTWKESYDRTRQLASALKGRGIGKGDTVMLMLGNQVELWDAMLAVLKLGAMALLWAWRRRLEPSPSFDDAATAALPGARP